MDVLNSILHSVQEHSVSSLENEEVPSDPEEEQSVKCNICGGLFSKEELLSHKLSHIQGNSKTNVSRPATQKGNAALPDKKPSYKCHICGKEYTVRKTFVGHKNNHRRNKKLKELGVHPFDKEGCMKLKANATTPTSEVKAANENISNLEEKLPVKLIINADVTANPMSCSGDWMPPVPVESNTHTPLVLENSLQIKKVTPEPKTSFKCKICDKIFTKRKTFLNHKDNHKRNKKEHKLFFYDRSKKKEMKNSPKERKFFKK